MDKLYAIEEEQAKKKPKAPPKREPKTEKEEKKEMTGFDILDELTQGQEKKAEPESPKKPKQKVYFEEKPEGKEEGSSDYDIWDLDALWAGEAPLVPDLSEDKGEGKRQKAKGAEAKEQEGAGDALDDLFAEILGEPEPEPKEEKKSVKSGGDDVDPLDAFLRGVLGDPPPEPAAKDSVKPAAASSTKEAVVKDEQEDAEQEPKSEFARKLKSLADGVRKDVHGSAGYVPSEDSKNWGRNPKIGEPWPKDTPFPYPEEEDKMRKTLRKVMRAQMDVSVMPGKERSKEVKHVIVFVSGLMGSGKSTLCRLMGTVFRGSIWVNQDECAKQGLVRRMPRRESPRQRFLQGVRDSLGAALAGDVPRLIFIDKMNHQSLHREDVFLAMRMHRWKERGGRLLLFDFSPKKVGDWDHEALAARIMKRGSAHKTLTPDSEEDIPLLVKRNTYFKEPFVYVEKMQFDSKMNIDWQTPTPEKAMVLIGELVRMGWTGALQWRPTVEPDAEAAMQAAQAELPRGIHVLQSRGVGVRPKEDGWEALLEALRKEFHDIQAQEQEWRESGSAPWHGEK